MECGCPELYLANKIMYSFFYSNRKRDARRQRSGGDQVFGGTLQKKGLTLCLKLITFLFMNECKEALCRMTKG